MQAGRAVLSCLPDDLQTSGWARVMPPRFHFRLVGTEQVIQDVMGVAAKDIEEAQAEATAAIEELRLQGELTMDAGEWCLEIRSASGVLLCSIQLP